MSSDVVKRREAAILPVEVTDFMSHAKADNTVRAYRAAWEDFTNWCDAKRIDPFCDDPSIIAMYISFCALGGLRVSTIDVRLAAIKKSYRYKGLNDPTSDEVVRTTMDGIRRKIGTRPNQKSAILLDPLRRAISSLPDSLPGKRDKAILLAGWALACRRGELVSLDIEDLTHDENGIRAILRRSKQDQIGAGTEKHIPYLNDKIMCPVTAINQWLSDARIISGPIFRKVDRWGKVSHKRLTDQVVAVIVKRAAISAGLDPKKFSGHSLRAGFVTQGILNDVDALGIQAVTAHESLDTITKYQRSAGKKARDVVRKAFGE